MKFPGRKGILLAAFMAAVLLFCVSCDPQAVSTPGPSVELSGGDGDLSANVNLREVAVEIQGDKTVVHLNFINGSRNSGVEESKLSSVPPYEVKQLQDPPRLEIGLQIGFSDYASTGTVFQGSVVNGIFDCVMEDARTQLYLQLAAPVSAESYAEGSSLTLELTPRAANPREAWYVGLNAVPSYCSGQIPSSLNLTPTMCEGFSQTILISEPFSSESRAQLLMEKAAAELPAQVPAGALYTFQMSTDSLPPYERMGTTAIAAGMAVIERGNTPERLPVLLEDGTWLTQTPEETIFYAVPDAPKAGSDSDEFVRQQLWMRDADGQTSRVTTDRFYDIQSALVSPDGRYIGILDAQTLSQVLYVFDLETKELLNLGEEGFGDYTVSFVWAPDSDMIYAMTGTAAALQLLRFDLDAPADVPKVSSIEERNGAESSISYAGGWIYYADQSDMTVYAVQAETGERRTLGSGIKCRISPDGSQLAVQQMRMLDEMEMTFDLVLADPQTGSLIGSVQENAQVEDFMFTADGGRLLYLTQQYDGVSAEYPFALLSYAGDLTLLCTSRTERIYASPDPNKLYLIYSVTTKQEDERLTPVTYTMEIAPQS